MNHFGLIGYPLSHSFSPDYFAKKFEEQGIEAEYLSYPLESISDFEKLIEIKNFRGLNVTIPYKEQIIPYLDEIDPLAEKVGAVNTILFENGKMIGYNTDVYGLEQSLKNWLPCYKDIDGALILGSGGASKAVQVALNLLGISWEVVSRNRNHGISYDDLTDYWLSIHHLIINTTPLGMYPKTDERPFIPYHLLNEKYFLYDLVYNPEKTLFLTTGLERGCETKNGYEMLILQAEKAWEIWRKNM